MGRGLIASTSFPIPSLVAGRRKSILTLGPELGPELEQNHQVTSSKVLEGVMGRRKGTAKVIVKLHR